MNAWQCLPTNVVHTCSTTACQHTLQRIMCMLVCYCLAMNFISHSTLCLCVCVCVCVCMSPILTINHWHRPTMSHNYQQ